MARRDEKCPVCVIFGRVPRPYVGKTLCPCGHSFEQEFARALRVKEEGYLKEIARLEKRIAELEAEGRK